ncbi:hypothetical protein CCYA_CCYA06G1720 [Cyanidiococcus yangmingshanensis]|nr:hypothetical protein CCYA_CCYA06G1720 [Cyanidiococcus yangmingshanensis]
MCERSVGANVATATRHQRGENGSRAHVNFGWSIMTHPVRTGKEFTTQVDDQAPDEWSIMIHPVRTGKEFTTQVDDQAPDGWSIMTHPVRTGKEFTTQVDDQAPDGWSISPCRLALDTSFVTDWFTHRMDRASAFVDNSMLVDPSHPLNGVEPTRTTADTRKRSIKQQPSSRPPPA